MTVYRKVKQHDDYGEEPVLVSRPNTNHDSTVDEEEEVVVGVMSDETIPPSTTPTVIPDPNNNEAPLAHSSTFWNVTRCAGCMGATAGCFTQGFCVSVLLGVGCIYCASVNEGVGGDIARAFGSVGVQANVMIRDLDEEHHLWERSKELGGAAWQRTKQWNEEYRIVESTKNCLVTSVKAGINFAREHKLVERTTKEMGQVLSVVAKEVVPNRNSGAANAAAEAFSDPEIYVTDDAKHDVRKEKKLRAGSK